MDIEEGPDMRIVKLLSDEEFEVAGNLKIGDVVKAGKSVAMVISLHHEEPELSKYLGIEAERLGDFLPDISVGERIARCFILHCVEHPKPGEEVELVGEEELKRIHLSSGGFSIPYLISLMKKCRDRLWIVRNHLEKLTSIIPEERELIEILKAEIEYRMLRDMEG
jgi:hypothetical protein